MESHTRDDFFAVIEGKSEGKKAATAFAVLDASAVTTKSSDSISESSSLPFAVNVRHFFPKQAGKKRRRGGGGIISGGPLLLFQGGEQQAATGNNLPVPWFDKIFQEPRVSFNQLSRLFSSHNPTHKVREKAGKERPCDKYYYFFFFACNRRPKKNLFFFFF